VGPAVLLPILLAVFAGPGMLRAARGEQAAAPASSPTPTAPSPEAAPASTPAVDLGAPLDPAERDTLQGLAWKTLVGHLTNQPIQDRDLEAFDLTPRLMARRGCFITLRKDGAIRGRQGEVEPTRPLYQQVIVFTRRAATRDPRFLPLTDRDLATVTLEIAVLGTREKVEGPAAIDVARQGIYLEKWGRGAALLPGQAAEEHWTAERALQELCRMASLPVDAWRNGSRIDVFTAEIIPGTQPAPTPSPGPVPPGAPSGASRRRAGRSPI
jgi:AmmeMemoRadiSam system protein A